MDQSQSRVFQQNLLTRYLRVLFMTIKSMKLYTNVERIDNELAEIGKKADDQLTVAELSQFDQLHYHGTEALDTAIKILNLNEHQKILEIGSGLGGPARYLSSQIGADITALELQVDQNQIAQRLSHQCGITENLHHICGDFLEHGFADQQFDAIVSWLALYHIPDRQKMLTRCHELLKAGGQFYTEDLYAREEFTEQECRELEQELYAITLPSWSDYQSEIEANGFEIKHCEEMSEDWAAFTHQRLDDYRANRARHVRVHGEATVDALDVFYSTVDRYFQSGKLGGVRLCARRF